LSRLGIDREDRVVLTLRHPRRTDDPHAPPASSSPHAPRDGRLPQGRRGERRALWVPRLIRGTALDWRARDEP
jgi:hypothetical protein